MKNKRSKPIFFVCAGLSDSNELQLKAIESSTREIAIESFINQFGFKPKDILGPFYKKYTSPINNSIKLVFSPVWKQAEYKDWYVRANILKEPKDYAFLIFKQRKDGQNLPKPQGKTVVSIYDLKVLNAE